MALIEHNKSPVKALLPILLSDKTTNHNIIFATDAYKDSGFDEKAQISTESIELLKRRIQPRVSKSIEAQAARTRTKAEVFTPSWIVNKMNNHCDEEWFGKTGVFNTELEQSWKTNKRKIFFGKKKDDWKEYVHSKGIEITCGEAPYIVSRYDASTGEIINIENRIGILDRKLRVINENTDNDLDWLEWVKRAYQNVYGYEFQGDNLLIARVNLLLTFYEYCKKRFEKTSSKKVITEIADIISTNEIETINSIVSANNNQNIVHDMINEITKEYHKKLEQFFRDYSDVAESRHVYYERRSKSLMNENICGYQKCTFRSLIQSTVAVWFDAPYDATNSEFKLITMYKNQVFSDNHKEICYYAAASLYSAYDKLLYENRINASLRSAKPAVCYLVKRSICPAKISLNDTEKTEEVAKKILSLLKNPDEILEEFEKALEIFTKAKQLFKEKNNNKNMSEYLSSSKIMSYIHGAEAQINNQKESEVQEKQIEIFSGKIIRIGCDRNGCSYMFITRGDESIFAHQNFTDNLTFTSLQTGQTVIYELSQDKFGREVAVNVRK